MTLVRIQKGLIAKADSGRIGPWGRGPHYKQGEAQLEEGGTEEGTRKFGVHSIDCLPGRDETHMRVTTAVVQ